MCSLGLISCSQIGIPVENHSESGYLDKEFAEPPSNLKKDLENYLKARNLLESVHRDLQGNWYIHQNWVQSPSLRYYLLTFDTRRHHLSEWKVVWYLQPSTSNKDFTKLRIAVLELLYLGDPDDKVKAPSEADGNWAEAELDKERAALLYADFLEWKKTGKLSSPAIYFKNNKLDGPPKAKSDIRQGLDLHQPLWKIPGN